MGFIYFAPGRQRVTAGDLASYGLECSVTKPQARECFSSPAGGKGCVFAENRPGLVVRMATDEQEWHKRADDLWIGWDKEGKPGPKDLARPSQLTGETLELADGNRWLIPVLRQWRPGDPPGPPILYWTDVPRTLDRNADGKWIEREVVDEYRVLWDRSSDVVDAFFQGLGKSGQATMQNNELFDFAVDLLSANYAVGYHEVSVLGLLTVPLATRIARIGVGADSLVDALGNATGRPTTEELNSNSGVGRPTMDAEISIPTDPPEVS